MIDNAIAIFAGLLAIATAMFSLRTTSERISNSESTIHNARTAVTFRSLIKLVALGWAIGNLCRTLRPFCHFPPHHFEAYGALCLLMATAIWLALLTRRSDRSHFRLQL